jgi:hypothetical protein
MMSQLRGMSDEVPRSWGRTDVRERGPLPTPSHESSPTVPRSWGRTDVRERGPLPTPSHESSPTVPQAWGRTDVRERGPVTTQSLTTECDSEDVTVTFGYSSNNSDTEVDSDTKVTTGSVTTECDSEDVTVIIVYSSHDNHPLSPWVGKRPRGGLGGSGSGTWRISAHTPSYYLP